MLCGSSRQRSTPRAANSSKRLVSRMRTSLRSSKRIVPTFAHNPHSLTILPAVQTNFRRCSAAAMMSSTWSAESGSLVSVPGDFVVSISPPRIACDMGVYRHLSTHCGTSESSNRSTNVHKNTHPTPKAIDPTKPASPTLLERGEKINPNPAIPAKPLTAHRAILING